MVISTMTYTTNDLRTIFKVAPETIRNWTREFARHLSVTANPEQGKTRLYTEEDIPILDLVNKMRENGNSYEEIHAALDAGQVGMGINVSPEELKSIVTGETEKKLSLEIQMLRRQLATAESQLHDLNALKEQNIRLDAEKEAERRRAEELSTQLREAQQKLEGLYREVGRSYHEGYVDALKEMREREE